MFATVFDETDSSVTYIHRLLSTTIRTPATFVQPDQLIYTFLNNFNSFSSHISDTQFKSTHISDLLDISFDSVTTRFIFKLKKQNLNEPVIGRDCITHVLIYIPPKLSLLFGFPYDITSIQLKRTAIHSKQNILNYLDRESTLNSTLYVLKINNNNDDYTSTTTSPSHHPFSTSTFLFSNSVTSVQDVDLLSGLHNMMIRCNFIQNNFVGNDELNVLDIVPFLVNDTGYVTHQFSKILHKLIRPQILRDIRIEITDLQGNRIPFVSGSSPVHISLIFKRIK